MSRLSTLVIASVAALGCTIASTNESRADTPFGFSLSIGNGNVQYSNGVRYLPAPRPYHHDHYRPAPVVRYDRYRPYPPPVVVVPTYRPAPYCPDNGPVLIPHRDHYHVRPY